MKRTFVLLLLGILYGLPMFGQRVLVISGGGARGAWGGGLAQALAANGRSYTKIIGTSTGSLLAPLILLGDFDKLKTAYTSVEQRDIFNVNPFKTKGKKKGSLKAGKAIWRILWGKRTLGRTERLRRLIRKFMTKEDFKRITTDKRGLEIIATVVNLTTNKVAYKSSKHHNYDEMVNWMWASSNQPAFMSLYRTGKRKTAEYWCDGGIKEFVAINKAIEYANELGDTEVDVIINQTERPQDSVWRKRGIVPLMFRTIDILNSDVRENDVVVGRLLAELSQMERDYKSSKDAKSVAPHHYIKLNIYFMKPDDYQVIPQALLFEKDKMLTLWQRGMETPDDHSNKCQQFVISKKAKLGTAIH